MENDPRLGASGWMDKISKIGNYNTFYWSVWKPGNYTIKYQVQFEKKVIATSECKITVLDRPTENNYLGVFVSSEAYSGSQFSQADSSCSILARDAKLKGNWASFSNDAKSKLVPYKAIESGLPAQDLPYRDLYGRLIAYNYDYFFNKLSTEGGGQWNRIDVTESTKKKAGLYKPLEELRKVWSDAQNEPGNPYYKTPDPQVLYSQPPITEYYWPARLGDKYYWAFQSGDCSANIPPQGVVCLEDPYMRVWHDVFIDSRTSARGTACTKANGCKSDVNADKILTGSKGFIGKAFGGIGFNDYYKEAFYSPNISGKMRIYCVQNGITP